MNRGGGVRLDLSIPVAMSYASTMQVRTASTRPGVLELKYACNRDKSYKLSHNISFRIDNSRAFYGVLPKGNTQVVPGGTTGHSVWYVSTPVSRSFPLTIAQRFNGGSRSQKKSQVPSGTKGTRSSPFAEVNSGCLVLSSLPGLCCVDGRTPALKRWAISRANEREQTFCLMCWIQQSGT